MPILIDEVVELRPAAAAAAAAAGGSGTKTRVETGGAEEEEEEEEGQDRHRSGRGRQLGTGAFREISCSRDTRGLRSLVLSLSLGFVSSRRLLSASSARPRSRLLVPIPGALHATAGTVGAHI